MAALTITADLAGTAVSREQVLRWEDHRITAAARTLGVPVPRADGVAARREALTQAKLALGCEEIAGRLRHRTRAAGWVARAGARVSTRRRRCVVDLHVDGGTAEQFADRFRAWTDTSDDVVMLRACPDHYVIRTRADGRQEVLETTGGSPLPSLFTIDYDDISTLVTPAAPRFPQQIAGVARADDGAAIGGVRHQFRNVPGGFDARLTVEFPLPTPSRMVTGHRWHLACEFSNWIEAAFA